MYKKSSEIKPDIRSNVRGGSGDVAFRHLFTKDELGGRIDLLAEITLEPGQSIGLHPHETNGEAYYICQGCVTVTEDDESRVLSVGDAEFCADGHSHSIRNHTDKIAKFLAVIVSNR